MHIFAPLATMITYVNVFVNLRSIVTIATLTVGAFYIFPFTFSSTNIQDNEQKENTSLLLSGLKYNKGNS